MRQETVDVLSDQTNAAVIRHPERRFPGVLVQGDTLFTLCQKADVACRDVGRGSPGFEAVNEVRNSLWGFLNHYKVVLGDHDLSLPFSEQAA
jgi:hypothetical protein